MDTRSVPAPLRQASDALAGYGRSWFLCGGWAADAWLEHETRSHLDVDIAVFQDDQTVLFEHLSGWDLLGHDNNVAEDCQDQWDGRHLDVPGHIHANSERLDGFELDIQVNRSADNAWIFAEQPKVTRPLDHCTALCAWGLPTVTPEVVLFYKAHPPTWRDTPPGPRRPHDDHDFEELLPTLGQEQRSWLRHALSLVNPTHEWLARLGR